MAQIVFRGNRADLKAALRSLPGALSGTQPDPTGLATGVRREVGAAALELFREAYRAKSRGGPDEAGTRWPDPKTKPPKNRPAAHPPMIDTGRVYSSLDPSDAECVLEDRGPDGLLVGSAVPYAVHLHRRGWRLWPEVGRWPARWWSVLLGALLGGAGRVLEQMGR